MRKPRLFILASCWLMTLVSFEGGASDHGRDGCIPITSHPSISLQFFIVERVGKGGKMTNEIVETEAREEAADVLDGLGVSPDLMGLLFRHLELREVVPVELSVGGGTRVAPTAILSSKRGGEGESDETREGHGKGQAQHGRTGNSSQFSAGRREAKAGSALDEDDEDRLRILTSVDVRRLAVGPELEREENESRL